MSSRVTGIVRFFKEPAGYGFLTPDEGSEDVFVHRTDLAKSCLQTHDGRKIYTLLPGQSVSYEVVDSGNNKGTGKKATNVELV